MIAPLGHPHGLPRGRRQVTLDVVGEELAQGLEVFGLLRVPGALARLDPRQDEGDIVRHEPDSSSVDRLGSWLSSKSPPIGRTARGAAVADVSRTLPGAVTGPL